MIMQKRLLNRNSSVVKSRNCLARHQHESSISKLHVSLRLHRCLRPIVRFDFLHNAGSKVCSQNSCPSPQLHVGTMALFHTVFILWPHFCGILWTVHEKLYNYLLSIEVY
ncbi:EC1118_1L10_2069p [Saccharomyces cerevisiae EC1118]|uniref:Putative uncharacterized protein YLR123C n=2 Tax=Saccharomyces cerevisiae TaxID=4932 RepID=YL123_YEAST|nr:RecName: Full=Putative uncharacterized protein YLR123C [Saccharomyces cerevisiae S288C]AAB82377.1 Ylr123cp [Saccharomyces cerevisiae]WNV72818.1 hypothetical protein O6U65_1678 [Saccharomyces cerevisiae synthetic construct]CAY81359.1 EC1118_1L10_2069p [Saccharomyces cerevisiae EC1118]AAT93372.1 YLR123C [Saccharomyces cerevisiae]CAA61702.1 L2970 [Saccharomyces cerevisiae]